jgi:hypothetical protein
LFYGIVSMLLTVGEYFLWLPGNVYYPARDHHNHGHPPVIHKMAQAPFPHAACTF